MNLLLFLGAFALVPVIFEYLGRRLRLSSLITRALAHAAAGILAAFTPLFLGRGEIAALAALLALAAGTTKILGFFPSIHDVPRRTFGEIFFPLGMGATALFALPASLRAFQFAMLVLGLADAAASAVGSARGRRFICIGGHRKSAEGAAAFFAFAFPLALLTATGSLTAVIPGALAVAGALTFLELLLPFGLDDFFIPLAAAYLFRLFLV